MLKSEVQAIRNGEVGPCQTLVIDTADASEALCISSVCANNDVTGIEKMPYGKGYVFVKEEWCRLLDLLSEVVERDINVVLLGHSRLDKFERPDESGAYDRFSPKLIDSKRASVSAATKEWADMVLFLDFKIYVEDEGGKAKAKGGRRVIHTTHHPCWDAKNRFGLPDEMPLNDASIERISSLMTSPTSLLTPSPAPEPSPAIQQLDEQIARMEEDVERAKSMTAVSEPDPRDSYPAELKPLVDLMKTDGISDHDLRQAVGAKGYFPYECPVDQYPAEFVQWLTSVWGNFVGFVKEQRQVQA